MAQLSYGETLITLSHSAHSFTIVFYGRGADCKPARTQAAGPIIVDDVMTRLHTVLRHWLVPSTPHATLSTLLPCLAPWECNLRAEQRWMSTAADAGHQSKVNRVQLTPALEARLQSIAARCAQLEQLMLGASNSSPGQPHDRQGSGGPPALSMSDIQREYGSLSPTAEQWKHLCKLRQELSDVESMIQDQDVELAKEARTEQRALSQQVWETEEKLLLGLLPRHEGDDTRGAIVEVRAGTGGAEASLFASELLDMYCAWSQRKGWACESLESSPSEAGGVRTASVAVSGAGSYQQLRWEAGVHRVQRVPVTETQGRLHTSTASVVVLPEADEVEMVVNDADLQIDTYRASGAGGQHVNTTSTAVRVTHFPTGLVVTCQDERSQIRNKTKALRVLRARLLQLERQKADQEFTAERKAQAGSADRNERIRTYNFGQDRLTDHRVGLSFQGLADIMTGHHSEALDRVHSALTLEERQQQIDTLLSATVAGTA